MNERHVFVLKPHPDRHGNPYIHLPYNPEGPAMLPYATARQMIWDRLKRHGVEFTLLEDFTEIQQWHARHNLPFDAEALDVYSRPHSPAIHAPGVYCSNCDVEDLSEIHFEAGDDDDAPDHPDDDDPYAQERAEDLREHLESVLIEHHADCAACGRDFILETWQIYLHMVLKDLVYCEDCRNIAEQRFGHGH
jgi:hypothetical protein